MDSRDMALDWHRLVRERLNLPHAGASDSEEIVAELASHLEESFEEQRALGISKPEAIQRALSDVSDWNRLNRRIQRAKREEGQMNDRTRHLWLPGLASFGAAVICEVALAQWSYQPRMLFHSHLTQLMYELWLVAQLACGAVGAFLSRRAGGSRSARLAAALFTSAILLLVVLGIVGTSLFARATGLWRQDFGSIDLEMLARIVGVMVVIPSVAMLIGALPFLTTRKSIATV
jgi:hypothetical protein